MKKNYGFTLVELMTVVVIVGIISTLAITSYQKYIINAKMAEAYQGVETVIKNQITYFYENKEFLTLDPSNPPNLDPTMMMVNSSPWNQGWLPAPVNSQVLFSYRALAGKTDGTGTELATSTISGEPFYAVASAQDYMRRTYTGGATCNPTYAATDLGASAQSNYNWFIVSAVGDLDGDQGTTCTAVAKLTEVSDATDQTSSTQGFIILNIGE